MCSEKLDVGAPTATTYDPNARDELAALVSSARQGDHLAWAAIVNRYSILLVSVIRSFRFEPEEARDIAQVVWLRLVEQLVNLRDPGALAGWLSTTTRNECIRRSRRQRESTPYHDLRNESANTKGPEEVALDHVEQARVHRCFGRLDDRCQQLLALSVSDIDGGYTSIAAMLNIPVGSIGPTRARCLDKLRRLLETSATNHHD